MKLFVVNLVVASLKPDSSMMAFSSTVALRYTLGVILAIVSLNAFGGGYYGMMGAREVPSSWLEGTPFTSYFIPSLLLFTVVGFSSLAASLALFFRKHSGRLLSVIAGFALLGWIVVQLSMIGYVSWLQPVMLAVAIIILILSWKGRQL